MKRAVVANGNEMVVEGAIDAGCRFFAGYPITPSSEVAEGMARKLPKLGGVFLQMEDEIASIACAIGGSLGGEKTMTASSGPGISLKQEGVGLACIAEIPLVIINAMRGGPSTGLPTRIAQSDIMQARWGTHGDHPAVAVCPGSVAECYTETVRAFNIAEELRTPVYVLSDAFLAHLSTKVELPGKEELKIANRLRPTVKSEEYYPYDTRFGDVPPLADYFSGYRFHVTGLNHDKTGFPNIDPVLQESEEERLINKVLKRQETIGTYENYKLEDAQIVVVAYGSNASGAKEAVDAARESGIKVGLFRPITIWPFPSIPFQKVAASAKQIIVTEVNLGQIVYEIERIMLGGRAVTEIKNGNLIFDTRHPRSSAELSTVLQANGTPIRPNQILSQIKEVA
ncbi:MAG: 2-oxoacid:acceptor oxidoreductase subunit alpha [Epsilonproteobacteria bacterium]|nr:2-oxoacid:acceptor oxidoreductase subunit alpha [Campylobacterota bacterium]